MTAAVWSELTAPQLTQWVDEAGERAVACVVLGATEQHGPHLPLGTDTDIGCGLLEHALDAVSDVPAIVMPPITIGASDEHAAFAGTLSLPPSVLIEQLRAYGQAVARAGIRRLVLVNAHGGNTAVIDLAALALRQDLSLLVAKAYYPKFAPHPQGPDAEELATGLHGGQLETSLMCALRPHHVDLAQARNFELIQAPWAGQAPVAWLGQDLNPQGVVGRAGEASQAEGETLVHHYARGLADVIEALADHPLPSD
jgi:creatinine amidohydrolase